MFKTIINLKSNIGFMRYFRNIIPDARRINYLKGCKCVCWDFGVFDGLSDCLFGIESHAAKLKFHVFHLLCLVKFLVINKK